MPTAQQFICCKCRALSNVLTFERTADGIYFARCEQCSAKNALVQTGQSASQPGLLPVMRLIQ